MGNTIIWAVGTAVFLGLLAVPTEVATRVGWAFFANIGAALVSAAVAMVLRLRRPLDASPFEAVGRQGSR